MADSRQHPPLPQDVCHFGRVVRGNGDDLQGHLAAECWILCAIDVTEAAVADGFEDLEAAPCPRQLRWSNPLRRGRCRGGPRRRGAVRGRLRGAGRRRVAVAWHALVGHLLWFLTPISRFGEFEYNAEDGCRTPPPEGPESRRRTRAYSYRIASTGDRLAALSAGYVPKISPTRIAAPLPRPASATSPRRTPAPSSESA